MKKDLKRLDKAFGQFKYYKVIAPEEDITVKRILKQVFKSGRK